jgi:hypothetical protein
MEWIIRAVLLVSVLLIAGLFMAADAGKIPEIAYVINDCWMYGMPWEIRTR